MIEENNEENAPFRIQPIDHFDEIVAYTEYEDCFMPDGITKKSGCNILKYNKSGELVQKEYMPVDPRNIQQISPALQAVMSAPPEDIEQIKRILGLIN